MSEKRAYEDLEKRVRTLETSEGELSTAKEELDHIPSMSLSRGGPHGAEGGDGTAQ